MPMKMATVIFRSSNGSAGTDCDDSNPSINATVTYYADTDEDGFGDNVTPMRVLPQHQMAS